IALRLREVCQELDNLYSDYYGISVQLGSLVELTPRRITASSLDAYKGIRYLRLAMLSDPNAWDVFLYYGTDDVYSRWAFGRFKALRPSLAAMPSRRCFLGKMKTRAL
nr:hypothetical protein [Clostridia bacterium]